jgi:hypothetical protein
MKDQMNSIELAALAASLGLNVQAQQLDDYSEPQPTGPMVNLSCPQIICP